jgi:hypothetical protein
MRRWFISCACYLAAIFIEIAVFIGLSLLSSWSFWLILLGPIVLVFSITWVALDHEKIHAERYYTGLPGRSVGLLLLFLILGWSIVLPWYLGLRFTIMAGTARLRDEYKPWRMSDGQMGPNGLIQPWRGKQF